MTFKKNKKTNSDWSIHEQNELIRNLKSAEKLLKEIIKGISDQFASVKKFYSKFVLELEKIKNYNSYDFTEIWLWFAPLSEWDYYTGKKGIALAEKTFTLLDNWKINQNITTNDM